MVAAHCVHVSDEDIASLSEGNVTVAHCPKSNAKLGSGIAPVAKMLQAGVRVAIGTDGAASNNRLDMLDEMRSAWVLQRGRAENPSLLPSRDVISLACTTGRSVGGIPENTLSEGAPADLVLLSTDRLHAVPSHDPAAMLAYAASSQDVTDVYVDGKALLKGGELRTIDEERVRWEVQHRASRIANS
jgi:5-methylthioadenosine/S-adenosylhomocysteine deaminase